MWYKSKYHCSATGIAHKHDSMSSGTKSSAGRGPPQPRTGFGRVSIHNFPQLPTISHNFIRCARWPGVAAAAPLRISGSSTLPQCLTLAPAALLRLCSAAAAPTSPSSNPPARDTAGARRSTSLLAAGGMGPQAISGSPGASLRQKPSAQSPAVARKADLQRDAAGVRPPARRTTSQSSVLSLHRTAMARCAFPLQASLLRML